MIVRFSLGKITVLARTTLSLLRINESSVSLETKGSNCIIIWLTVTPICLSTDDIEYYQHKGHVETCHFRQNKKKSRSILIASVESVTLIYGTMWNI